jgi:hypothetical protein
MTKWAKCVGEGWSPIVDDAIIKIENFGGYILQVKEKFGGLRIYSHGGDYEAIDTVVHEAAAKAAGTCERCGEPGILRKNANGYLFTSCERHISVT